MTAATLVDPKAGKGIERELHVQIPHQLAILGEKVRLQQIVTNLLTNAIKFTPSGGTVTIESGPADGRAALTVSDTGIGIPDEELPHIFDRFWRGREAAQTSGSGIGLAIAAELTRAHGGELTAVSRAGRGTSLTLTLPAS